MRRAAPDPLIEARRRGPIPSDVDPAIEALVNDIIAKVADKWTMLILEALDEHGTLRFTQLGKTVGRISQKMLTQTVRQMEQDGLVRRTVHPVIPPRVDYTLTPLGQSLGAAFCGVWIWAETHHAEIERARRAFSAVAEASVGSTCAETSRRSEGDGSDDPSSGGRESRRFQA